MVYVFTTNSLSHDHHAVLEEQSVAGGTMTKGTSVETSVIAAWRKALVNTVFTTRWDDNLSYDRCQSIARQMTSSMDILRGLAPQSGAYFNETDPDQSSSSQGY